MLAIDFLKANARGAYTCEPIRMIRTQSESPCDDYRPGDVYLRASDGPKDCGCPHQHVKVRTCDRVESARRRSKHKNHGANCYAWFHVAVEVDGFLFTDGRFTAKVFADADMPKGNEWKSKVPAFRTPKFHRTEPDVDAIRALAAQEGIECAEVLDTGQQIGVASIQEAT